MFSILLDFKDSDAFQSIRMNNKYKDVFIYKFYPVIINNLNYIQLVLFETTEGT